MATADNVPGVKIELCMFHLIRVIRTDILFSTMSVYVRYLYLFRTGSN